MPPAPPPHIPKFGSYCFRATVDVLNVNPAVGCPVVRGRVVGYDTTPMIGKHTEIACRVHAKKLGRRDRAHVCGEASVVMLPHAGTMECGGEMYFEVTGKPTKRLV